jgi:hypothetical protein
VCGYVTSLPSGIDSDGVSAQSEQFNDATTCHKPYTLRLRRFTAISFLAT